MRPRNWCNDLKGQFIAFLARWVWFPAARTGAKRAFALSLVIWLGVTIYTYALLETVTQFFILAGVIAIVLGGSQALSRSLFSLMIPAGKEAEYFSLYEVSERGTSWMGTLIFGLTLQFSGSYRLAILSIAIFFAIGLLILTRVDVRRAIAEAGNEIPSGV